MNDPNDVLVFKERAGKPGGGKGILIGVGKTFTLSTLLDQTVCYDARGNGNGQIAPTITGDHENRVTDYTAIVVGTNSKESHSVFAVESHPSDSRMTIAGEISPTPTVKIRKGSADGPLVLIGRRA